MQSITDFTFWGPGLVTSSPMGALGYGWDKAVTVLNKRAEGTP